MALIAALYSFRPCKSTALASQILTTQGDKSVGAVQNLAKGWGISLVCAKVLQLRFLARVIHPMRYKMQAFGAKHTSRAAQ